MKTAKLQNHAGCQCHVCLGENRIDFISYTTRVISIIVDAHIRKVECMGTYSRTTARQISYFLREYAPDLCLADMKKIAGCGFVAC